MTEQKRPAAETWGTAQELSDEQLADASGAFDPQPDPPARSLTQVGQFHIGAQSTGAGAGKVTF